MPTIRSPGGEVTLSILIPADLDSQRMMVDVHRGNVERKPVDSAIRAKVDMLKALQRRRCRRR